MINNLGKSLHSSLAIVVAKAIVGNSSLGHWVKTSAGSKWNMSGIAVGSKSIRISITQISSISIGLSISGSLAIVISQSIVRDSSLGHRVKTLGDWVKSSAGSKRNMSGITIGSISIRISITQIGSISLGLSISRSFSIMISKTIVGDSSLGHRVKSLGDWVKTSAGSKWDMSGITVSSKSIRISITQISSISIGLSISRSLA